VLELDTMHNMHCALRRADLLRVSFTVMDTSLTTRQY